MRLLTAMALTIFCTILFLFHSELSSISLPERSSISLPELSSISLPELSSISLPELSSISLLMSNIQIPQWLKATHAAATIPAAEASRHVGELSTVCGRITTLHTRARSRGAPTCIHLDEPYPNRVFTVLVLGSDRANVGAIPSSGMLCATGIITSSRGTPEIVVKDTKSWYVPK